MTALAALLPLGFAVCAIVLLSRLAGLVRQLATQPEREASCLSNATAQIGDLPSGRHSLCMCNAHGWDCDCYVMRDDWSALDANGEPEGAWRDVDLSPQA